MSPLVSIEGCMPGELDGYTRPHGFHNVCARLAPFLLHRQAIVWYRVQLAMLPLSRPIACFASWRIPGRSWDAEMQERCFVKRTALNTSRPLLSQRVGYALHGAPCEGEVLGAKKVRRREDAMNAKTCVFRFNALHLCLSWYVVIKHFSCCTRPTVDDTSVDS